MQIFPFFKMHKFAILYCMATQPVDREVVLCGPQSHKRLQTFCIQYEYFQTRKLFNFIQNFHYKFQVLTL